MPNLPSWHHLPLRSSLGLPVLLVTMDVGTASYTVQVTDMANIWTESLDRKAICIRAWGENTSIDPSDTADNMAKFISSLKSALDSSQPGYDQTSLTLSSAKFDDAGENGLTLKITCNLPGMQPLRWPIHLKKGPPPAIATDLVLPLIQAHYARKQEVESLIQALGHKDAVISKLVDKLEAVGTGLEHVFTALSGRKKVSRSVAEEKIRGLAPFSEGKWKAGLEKDDAGPANAAELAQSVFEGENLPSRSYIEFDKSPGLEGWWHDVKIYSEMPIRQQSKNAGLTRASPEPRTRSEEPAEDEDDDFQVQSTPPRLKSNKKRKEEEVAPIPDDASTQDEDEMADSDSEPPVTSHKTSKNDAKQPVSRLGAIGGKKQAPVKGPPSPERNTKVNDSETASEADEDEDATASIVEDSPSPPPPPQRSAPKKGGLGRIGGKKAQPIEKAKTPEPDAEEGVEPATKTAITPKKLGHIGKAADEGALSPSAHDGKRGRQSTRQQGSDANQQHRETSQERANRRREELKRELERKAAAGPAKKKRRF